MNKIAKNNTLKKYAYLRIQTSKTDDLQWIKNIISELAIENKITDEEYKYFSDSLI